MKKNKKVAFISLTIPSYKVFICEALDKLYEDKFFVLHGQESPGTTPRDVRDISIRNNINVNNSYWEIKDIEISWVPVIWWFLKNRPKTIILGDGVRILQNYVLHFISKLIGTKVIYYTHGHNHQAEFSRGSTVQSFTERVRKLYFKYSDALIVYTDANKTYLENANIKTKVFVSNNTLNTPDLLNRQKKVNDEIISELKQTYDIKDNQHIILYLGRMVPEKEVHLFANLIRELNTNYDNDYYGIAIGDGSLLEQLQRESKDLPITYTGHLSGQTLSNHLACADCMFIPSHVGLAVVEAFCASLPFITCEGRHHSPEVDYIQHGVNGLILDSAEPESMALEISSLMKDDKALATMSSKALDSAHKLHPENSIKAFVDAIEFVNN